MGLSRRDFIASGALAAGAMAAGPGFLRSALAAPAQAGAGPYGELLPPDANGIQLPPGFSSRMIAQGGQAVPGTSYAWHIYSDGQAVFRTPDNGWILVSNSESPAVSGGGSSAIRFGRDGAIQSAYRILAGTNINCAGGPTPWGTWLSCEEYDGGHVWECDPTGAAVAQSRPALGTFSHEAAAVDPVGRALYLTEDQADGGLYRFIPHAYPDLSEGLLEVAVVGVDGRVSWRELPDPSALGMPTRQQIPEMTRFNGGEGIWYAAGVLYFTTKGDKKVWAYDARSGVLEVLYDRAAAPGSSLDAVDNVTVTGAGEIFVCEDGGNMEIGLITRERVVSPFLRLPGAEHEGSELCGVVFDPSGTRMYLASQRAFPSISGQSQSGMGAVYEVRGPFRGPPGPPFDVSSPPPTGKLRVKVRAPRRIRRRPLLRRGLNVRVECASPVSVTVALTSADLARTPGKGGSSARPRQVRLATKRIGPRRKVQRLTLRLGRRARRRLRRRRGVVSARLLIEARDGSGRRLTVTRHVRIGRARRRSA